VVWRLTLEPATATVEPQRRQVVAKAPPSMVKSEREPRSSRRPQRWHSHRNMHRIFRFAQHQR
jgi:hypothetical protein